MALQSTTALATITLQEASETVEFSGIPDTYRDLVLVISGQASAADSSVNVQINTDTNSANYPMVYAYGNGSSSGVGTLSSNGAQVSYFPGSGPVLTSVNFMDYSATDKHTTILSRQDQASGWVAMWAGRWANTNAINQIKIVFAQAGRTWNTGTTFALFGRIA